MKTVHTLTALLALALIGLLALPASNGQGADKSITNSIDMKLVPIPAGSFQMGSPTTEAERDDMELPHEVKITHQFWMGAYPVTQAQYEKVTKSKPSAFGNNPDNPVDQVRWPNAVDFCRKLSALPEEKKAGRVYRLPTEAEWEYACRAGTTTPFYCGTALSSKEANINGNYPYGGAAKGPFLHKTCKVGSYPPNTWGLYDMHGNVWEWCADWYDPDYYKKSPKEDPKGPDKGVISTGFPNGEFFRVVRGGCWLDEARACRSANRFRLMPNESYRWVGFRVACDVMGK